jgi:hypothetical protein
VWFSPPSWAVEEAEPAVDTPTRVRKAPSFEETWKPLIARFTRWDSPGSTHLWPTEDSGLPPEELAFVRGARARLERRSEGEGFDPALEAYTYALSTLIPTYELGEDARALPQRALAHWTARSDAATAASTLLDAELFATTDAKRWVRAIPRALETLEGLSLDGAVQYALREHLRQHGRGPVEVGLRERLRPMSPSRRAARAWILDDAEEATRAVAEAKAAGQIAWAVNVLGVVPSPEDAASLLDVAYDHGRVVRAALRHGLAFAEAIAGRHYLRREHVHAAACFPSILTARLLVSLLAGKPERKLVGQALANMPAEALRALEEERGKKTKYRDAIDALIATISATRSAGGETSSGSPAGGTTSVDEAPLEALPPVFRAPPWRAKKRAAAEATFDGLTPRAVEPVVDLSSIDPKTLARDVQLSHTSFNGGATVESLVARLARNEWVEVRAVLPLSLEDLEAMRTAGVLPKLRGGEYWVHDAYSPGLTAILARHGAPAIPALIALAPALKGALAAELAYAGAVEVAPLVLGWMGGKATRKAAEQWARRFPRHAAAALVPIALGPASGTKAVTERDRARLLLASIARAGHRAVILEEAAHHGDAVRDAAALLLDRDPLELAPSKPPKLLEGLEGLPRVTLRDGRALSAEATTLLLEMLAFSPADPPYVGIEQTKEACDPRSLDAFVEALVRTWVAAGMPTAHEWAVRAVALIGTDKAARFLFDRARAWAQDNQKQRAILAIDVLGAMGTDLALSLVGRMSRSSLRQYMKDRAVELLAEIASNRGLTTDELEDRTAPELGLDEHGSMRLDFGPRSFRVGFDEHLRPFAQTEAGERLDALPRASKSDDAALAKAAGEAWKTLKSEAEKVARDQIARLERMMGEERRVEAEVFRDAFVAHPLVGHLAKRLVWGAFDASGALLETFRVAEDRSLATVEDEPYALPDTARVGVIHPYALRDQPGLAARWGQVLSDYAILQPFAQLGRPVLSLAPADLGLRYLDKKAPTSLLYGLRTHGWRTLVGEYGEVQGFERHLGDHRFALHIRPGIVNGEPSKLHDLSLSAWSDGGAAPTPVQLSELVFQLDGVLAT